MTHAFAGDEDPDADLFGESSKAKREESGHALDGSICQRCGIVHEVETRGDVPIPDEIMAEVAKALGDMPPAIARSSKFIIGAVRRGEGINPTEVRTQFVNGFTEFTRDMNRAMTFGPALRALAELIDELTGGEFTRRWSLYALEGQLLAAHRSLHALRGLNKIVTATVARDIEPPPGLVQAMALLIETLETVVSEIVGHYREAAIENRLPVDEKLIANGNYEGANTFAQKLMVGPLRGEMDDTMKNLLSKDET